MEERRNDVELRLIGERVDNLIHQIERDEKNAEEWRKRFCVKFDLLMSKVDALPCPARVEITKAIRSDIGWIQKIAWSAGGFLCVVMLPWLIGLSVSWGALNTTVQRNTAKWDKLDQERVAEAKDIKDLKDKSYGYRGIKVVTNEHGGV